MILMHPLEEKAPQGAATHTSLQQKLLIETHFGAQTRALVQEAADSLQ